MDDLVLAAKSDQVIRKVKDQLAKSFEVTDMGPLKHFLGVRIVQQRNGSVWMGQDAYAENVLARFQMSDS